MQLFFVSSCTHLSDSIVTREIARIHARIVGRLEATHVFVAVSKNARAVGAGDQTACSFVPHTQPYIVDDTASTNRTEQQNQNDGGQKPKSKEKHNTTRMINGLALAKCTVCPLVLSTDLYKHAFYLPSYLMKSYASGAGFAQFACNLPK